MTPLALLLAASIVLEGPVSSYAPTRMESNIARRQAKETAHHLPIQLPPVDGYIAMADEDLIGRIVFIRFWDQGSWQSFLVADCAGKSDRQSETDSRSGWEWMKSTGIKGEVDYNTAKKQGKTWGGIPAEIIVPPENAIILPARLGGYIPDFKEGFTTVKVGGFEVYLPKERP